MAAKKPAGGGGGGEEEEEGMGRVRRKKDFRHMERVDGRMVNVLQGLELHTGVFSVAEQRAIVECVHDMQDRGRRGLLRERTYSEPRKWMRGKGRATIQFGCCYNYATDRAGNPAGIIRDEEVDRLPAALRAMVRRLVEWRVLPPACVPDTCIVNIYEEGDCIPPHIDHHDFLRPFCTASFLSQCSILFGRGLKVVGPGDFAGPVSIPLPVGSVLVLSGNGADVAKHCVPAVPAKRISITFRKMHTSKVPFGFSPDPELQNLAPLPLPLPSPSPVQPVAPPPRTEQESAARKPEQPAPRPGHAVGGGGGGWPASSTPRSQQGRSASGDPAFILNGDEFPALGASPAIARRGRR